MTGEMEKSWITKECRSPCINLQLTARCAFKRIASSSRTRANFPTHSVLHFTYERHDVNFKYVKLELVMHARITKLPRTIRFCIMARWAMRYSTWTSFRWKATCSLSISRTSTKRHGCTIAWRTHCRGSTVLVLHFNVLNPPSGITVPSPRPTSSRLFIRLSGSRHGTFKERSSYSTKLYSNIADLDGLKQCTLLFSQHKLDNAALRW